MTIGLIAAWAVTFGAAGGWYARRRRRAVAPWVAIGAVIGPLALLILERAPLGRCPSCEARVSGWVQVCAWCGGDVRRIGGAAPGMAAPVVERPPMARPTADAPPPRPARPAEGALTADGWDVTRETADDGPGAEPTRPTWLPSAEASGNGHVAAESAIDETSDAAGSADPPVESDTDVADAAPTEPIVAEPVVTEPVVTEPVVAEVSDAAPAEPASSEPAAAPAVAATATTRATRRRRRTKAEPPVPAGPPFRTLASAVFVTGSVALQPGSWYSLELNGVDLRVLGPLDRDPSAVVVTRPLGPLDATAVNERLVVNGQDGLVMVFMRVAGMAPDDVVAALGEPAGPAPVDR